MSTVLTFGIALVFGAITGLIFPPLGMLGEIFALLTIVYKFYYYLPQVQSGDIVTATSAITNFISESLIVVLNDYMTIASVGFTVGYLGTAPIGFKVYKNIFDNF